MKRGIQVGLSGALILLALTIFFSQTGWLAQPETVELSDAQEAIVLKDTGSRAVVVEPDEVTESESEGEQPVEAEIVAVPEDEEVADSDSDGRAESKGVGLFAGSKADSQPKKTVLDEVDSVDVDSMVVVENARKPQFLNSYADW